jgi:hypothetical protein
VQIYSIAGYTHKTGYRRINIDGKQYQAHRLAFLYITGTLFFTNLFLLWVIEGLTPSQNNFNPSSFISVSSNEISVKLYFKNANNFDKLPTLSVDRTNGEFIEIGFFFGLKKVKIELTQADKKYGYHQNHGGA